jgi:hypothetical protein
VPVTRDEIRELFEQRRYFERWRAGEFLSCLKKEVVAGPHQPPGTRSLMVGFVNRDGIRECLVHFYYLPDGKIGASGKPDPKEIVDSLAIYRLYLRSESDS